MFKLSDINDSNIHMVYNFLKAIKGKRLFLAKNIHVDKSNTGKSKQSSLYNVEHEVIAETYYYKSFDKNFINEETDEIFAKPDDFKELEKDIKEKSNYPKLSNFFRKEAQELIEK